MENLPSIGRWLRTATSEVREPAGRKILGLVQQQRRYSLAMAIVMLPVYRAASPGVW